MTHQGVEMHSYYYPDIRTRRHQQMTNMQHKSDLTPIIVRTLGAELTTEGKEVYAELGNIAADVFGREISQQEARIRSAAAVSGLDALPPSDREHITRMVGFQVGTTPN
jgi:hypothetical protein